MEDPDARITRCARCGDALGIYERIIVTRAGVPARASSLAAEPLPRDARGFHERCYDEHLAE